MNNDEIIVESTIPASPQKIWNALTDEDQLKKWYFDLGPFKAEPGFEFEFFGEGKEGKKYLHKCTVLEVLPNRKISYSWKYEGFEGNSIVSFQLFPEGKNTRLKITHTGLQSFPASNPDLTTANFVEGWTYFAQKGLPEYLAKTGDDFINKN